MNPVIDRIVYFLIFVQLGITLVNITEITPGHMLQTGFSTSFVGFTTIDAENLIINQVQTLSSIISNLKQAITNFDWLFLIGQLLNMGVQLIILFLSFLALGLALFEAITVGSFFFYLSVLSLIDVPTALIWAGLLARTQTVIFVWELSDQVVAILGGKVKSVGTAGVLGK